MTSELLQTLAHLPENELSSVVSKLSFSDLKLLLRELERAYMADPWLWLCSEVITIDEASQTRRPWPDKPYLQDLFHVFATERLIFIPKSRRMMASWAVAAWAVYKARFWPNHAIFIQSATEDKAAYITDKRCAFIEDNLREPALRRSYRSLRTHHGLIGRITYDLTKSYIWAVAQGDDVIRSYTFSILIMDESEFQPEGQRAFDAALSIVQDRNQIIVLSTSNGPVGVLADVCRSAGFTKFV